MPRAKKCYQGHTRENLLLVLRARMIKEYDNSVKATDYEFDSWDQLDEHLSKCPRCKEVAGSKSVLKNLEKLKRDIETADMLDGGC